jgi:two-component system, NtrC family, sensor kinase
MSREAGQPSTLEDALESNVQACSTLPPARASTPAQPHASDAKPPTAERVTSSTPRSEHYLEVLLELANAIPLQQKVPPIASRVVDTLSRLLPDCAVGLCLAGADDGKPLLEIRLPLGSDPDRGHDPTRLFPKFTHERTIEISDEQAGSMLHLASSVRDPGPGSAEHEIAVHALAVLKAALRRSRELQRSQRSSDDLRKLQAQVIQAEKLASLGQIVAGVVHELNNPLTSIVAYAEYLKRKAQTRKASAEEIADDMERLRRIGEAAERILKFSRDLVAYARPSTDIPAPVVLQNVIDKAIIFCEHEFAQNEVAVERDLPEYLPPVRGIAGQLTQVFVNLFTNAAHAMRSGGGRLRVTAKPLPSSFVLVEVVDDGIGIDPQDLEQIFEPFFTTKSDGRGTGLGLSIVRDIIGSHGGHLKARSTPGEGTMFAIHLPMAAVPPSLVPPRRRGED